jgi:hypothetical protein
MSIKTIFACALTIASISTAHAVPGDLADMTAALANETARLKGDSSFQLNAEAYTFARDVRKMEYDSQRADFAQATAAKGAAYFAIYETAYKFAVNVRSMQYDSQRDDFATAAFAFPTATVGGTIAPSLPIYMEAYNFAKKERALQYDSQRDEFAAFVVKKSKPDVYVTIYEQAYIFARDVRKLQYDSQRAEFAEQQAAIGVSSVVTH